MRRREFITAARWRGHRMAARGTGAADRPGASPEMLRVECAGACDDKFATREAPSGCIVLRG
jgi:hypothetical protein